MTIEDLVGQINIVDYISQFVDLEKRTDGQWWGLSPFTNEKTPSFTVSEDPSSPFFHDFSSGSGGNVYSFIRKYFNVGPEAAVQKMKEYVGYDGEVETPHRMSALQICKQFEPKVKQQKVALSKPLPDDCMNVYQRQLDKMKVWGNEGISIESMDKFQVKYDPFSNRLVYPIRNMDGKIVNVGGRVLDQDWKERGERKYTYFYSWGTINTIYGVIENIEAIKSSHEVILFEGCKSVLIADTWGVHNCGAILTSHLSSSQLKILAKLGASVTFALDEEIRIKDDKNIQKLKNFVNVYYLWDRWNLLRPKDAPVDMGEKVFKTLYENKVRLR